MKIIPISFGDIAVAEGYITQQTLQQCLQKQQTLARPQLLGNIMKEMGILSEDQVTRILKMQQIYKTRLENEYFAHVAQKMEHLNSIQLFEIRKQHSYEAASGNHLNFATIAVQKEYLSADQAKEVIRSDEYKYFVQLKKNGRSVVSGYELVGVIAKLEKMVIYKAIQVELDRLVAIKILTPEYENEDNIRKFFYEAQITACFYHPNLVRVYDKGLEENRYFYAMELVEGKNLAQTLKNEGRLQVGEAVKVMRQIARALQHIHDSEKIHTEVNPNNIIIRDDGVGKLLHLSSCCSIKKERLSIGKMSKMPQYMAPEQIEKGKRLDKRTDIYGLGATFYRILTGQPPIRGKNLEEIRSSILEQEVIPINEIDFTIPEDLARIVHRMMRKNPMKRYPEIKNVLFALKKILI